MTHRDLTKRTALVTGASTGIGAEFARELAARGATLVLVARSRDRLERLADELRAAHAVRVEVLAEDLTADGAVLRLRDAVARLGLRVDLLINNAGFATHGAFEQTPIARQREEVDLNVRALVEVSHAFVPDLIATRGDLVHVASTAAFQPVPRMAVYAASKAFVLSFSEALYAELRGRGVRVLALCPGATETPFFAIAGEAAALGPKADPRDLVRFGLRALERGHAYAIHGFGNYLLANLARFVPRALVARISSFVMRRNEAKLLPAAT